MAKSNMDQDILKVLYSEEQLKTRVQEMGDELYERWAHSSMRSIRATDPCF